MFLWAVKLHRQKSAHNILIFKYRIYHKNVLRIKHQQNAIYQDWDTQKKKKKKKKKTSWKLTTKMITKSFGVISLWYNWTTTWTDITNIINTIIDFFLCGETIETSWWVLKYVIDGRWTKTFFDGHLSAVFYGGKERKKVWYEC